MSWTFNARPRRRGYTLIESLMAAAILLVIVIAVTSAVLAGQQHALEAHQRIAGTLAAEELMGRISTVPYPSLANWNGHQENVDAMEDILGDPMPDSFSMIGRSVSVASTIQSIPELGINIQGRTVTVRAFNGTGRILVELEQFIPEPAS